MPNEALLQRIVTSAGLGDIWDRARAGARIGRTSLESVLHCGHPLAAAALADIRREASSGVVVTHPWTLRVRAPGRHFTSEPAMLVSHPVDRLRGHPASELQIVGDIPLRMKLAEAIEMIRAVKSERSDVPLRAFTSAHLAGIADADGSSIEAVATELSGAGLDTLDWAPGDGLTRAAAETHHAAHEAGLSTIAPAGYERNGVDTAYLDRLDELRRVAEGTGGFVSVAPLPSKTEGASPLHGTSGNEDALAFALARLALGHVIPRVTVDAHVLGHKLGAVLLSCGADDFVGAQAAETWAAPTDDGPRPLNADRVRRYVIEARRSPELRDALFQSADGSTG